MAGLIFGNFECSDDRSLEACLLHRCDEYLTIGNRDISRAADRAARLEKATGVTTFAVAIGEHIPAHQETRANAMNVTLIQIAE